MGKPIVAIVGRPNVGKSTLFNRLIGERRAIVEDEPGTTRDRVYGTSDWGGVEFTIIDTGGLQDDQELVGEPTDILARFTRDQAHAAIAEADVIVFMVDGKSGMNAGDHEVAEILRRADKPTILVANKAESADRRDARGGRDGPAGVLHGDPGRLAQQARRRDDRAAPRVHRAAACERQEHGCEAVG